MTANTSALAQRYAPHIADVCAKIAAEASLFRLISPLLVLVWRRLRRMLTRLDSLATRWERGRLRPPRKSRPHAPPEIHPAEAWLPRRTPQGHAWLIRLHQPLAQLAPRIELLLNDPDIAALAAVAPQTARLLRPFARMFGLALPAHLRPPPRQKPPPHKPPPRPRTPKPKPPPFRVHSPDVWPFVPLRLRLRVPGLNARKLRD